MIQKRYTLLENHAMTISTALIALLSTQSQTERLPERATFVLLRSGSPVEVVHQIRAAKRLAPYSTFKIPNTLIALENGKVTSLSQVFAWQGEVLPGRPEIERDFVIRDAFQNSANWVYQRLAREIGKEEYRRRLKVFGFGNANVDGPIDQFWLGSSLKVSAIEQVRFLDRLASRRLGLSNNSYRLMDDIAFADEGKGWKLFAKTGSARSGLAWYVGWVRRGSNVWSFALNIEGTEANRNSAIRLAKEQLRQRKLID